MLVEHVHDEKTILTEHSAYTKSYRDIIAKVGINTNITHGLDAIGPNMYTVTFVAIVYINIV